MRSFHEGVYIIVDYWYKTNRFDFVVDIAQNSLVACHFGFLVHEMHDFSFMTLLLFLHLW